MPTAGSVAPLITPVKYGLAFPVVAENVPLKVNVKPLSVVHVNVIAEPLTLPVSETVMTSQSTGGGWSDGLHDAPPSA